MVLLLLIVDVAVTVTYHTKLMQVFYVAIFGQQTTMSRSEQLQQDCFDGSFSGMPHQ